jgi:hypothetical protein
MRFLVLAVVLALFMQGLASAGDINPTQKTTTTPTQKTTTPTQKTTTTSTPTQKTTTTSTPTQKTTTFDSPVQKGSATSANIPVPVPQELLDALARLQPQECEPVRNLGRAIARRCIKRKISDFIQDNLPTNPLPLP